VNADATAALPGMGSAAEAAIEKCRALFRAPAARVDRGALLWQLLNADERRFLCRVARIEYARAGANWRDLSEGERAELDKAWLRLRAWVQRIERHLERVAP